MTKLQNWLPERLGPMTYFPAVNLFGPPALPTGGLWQANPTKLTAKPTVSREWEVLPSQNDKRKFGYFLQKEIQELFSKISPTAEHFLSKNILYFYRQKKNNIFNQFFHMYGVLGFWG